MLRKSCTRFPNVSLDESLYSIDYADKSSSPSRLAKQILQDIFHDDAIVKGVSRDVIGSKYSNLIPKAIIVYLHSFRL